MNMNKIEKETEVAKTIQSQYHKGFSSGFQTQNAVIQSDPAGEEV